MRAVEVLLVLTISFACISARRMNTIDLSPPDCCGAKGSVSEFLVTLLKECRESNALCSNLVIEQDALPSPKCDTPEVVPEIHSGLACEGSTLYLECPVGKTIKIISANYGRTEGGSICPSSAIRTTACEASNSQANVSARCNNSNKCSVAAVNGVFGDPCIGTHKYLKTTFNCI